MLNRDLTLQSHWHLAKPTRNWTTHRQQPVNHVMLFYSSLTTHNVFNIHYNNSKDCSNPYMSTKYVGLDSQYIFQLVVAESLDPINYSFWCSRSMNCADFRQKSARSFSLKQLSVLIQHLMLFCNMTALLIRHGLALKLDILYFCNRYNFCHSSGSHTTEGESNNNNNSNPMARW